MAVGIIAMALSMVSLGRAADLSVFTPKETSYPLEFGPVRVSEWRTYDAIASADIRNTSVAQVARDVTAVVEIRGQAAGTRVLPDIPPGGEVRADVPIIRDAFMEQGRLVIQSSLKARTRPLYPAVAPPSWGRWDDVFAAVSFASVSLVAFYFAHWRRRTSGAMRRGRDNWLLVSLLIRGFDVLLVTWGAGAIFIGSYDTNLAPLGAIVIAVAFALVGLRFWVYRRSFGDHLVLVILLAVGGLPSSGDFGHAAKLTTIAAYLIAATALRGAAPVVAIDHSGGAPPVRVTRCEAMGE